MIIIKLGGSIITNKQKPLTAKPKIINTIVEKLKTVDEQYIIVHGGGSFGHYWSVKYNMHTEAKNYDKRGISVVKNSMIELNKIVLDVFYKNDLFPYVFPASNFIDIDGKPIQKKIIEMKEITESGLIPITYGDVLWYIDKKSYILSGDKIMTILAKLLKPRLCIFVLNENGIYSDFNKKKLIYNLDDAKPDVKIINDATGGIKRKYEEAKLIKELKLKVFFTNGNKPSRIIDAINDVRFEGTTFE